ncbi:MAG: dihydroneopterin aldolase [Pseudomonadota bacterium]
MPDRILIRDLAVECVIGCNAWEREVRQALVFEIDLTRDCSAAGASDDLRDTIDYGAVAQRVTEIAIATEARLIEHLAETVAAALLKEFSIATVRVRLWKPTALAGATRVAVDIERSRA